MTNVSAPEHRNADRVAGVAILVSLFSFLYFYQHGDLLLYGDAVAHINIARRVFDSMTPGVLQLGTVWLPLPHLLMIPFIFSNAMWRNGSGASIPSMIAFVFGAMGMFRLVRGLLDNSPRTKSASVVGGWAAALVYVMNPNLIYMQATAMTESIYLALFIWAVVYFSEFVHSLHANETLDRPPIRSTRIPLLRCAGCLAAAELTRYDGWFLAAVMGSITLLITLQQWTDPALRRLAVRFLIIISVVPVLWLAYNRIVYGNALEFANGPYSAKAIEQRIAAPNPALNSAPVAALYFMKSAQLNMADGNWGRFWVAGALIAFALSVWKFHAQSTALLLWIPLVFYALSIAYGSVPIHVYTWWPFATFNQRYGLQLLPMFAASAGLLTAFAFLLGARHRHAGKLVALPLALVIVSYASVWKAEPQCLKEAKRNWDIRHVLNSEVQRIVAQFPPNSIFLMELGEHVGIMQDAGIPLRRVVNNENHRPWVRPTDPEGLWERALADPSRYVDFVIAFDGDLVDIGANKSGLTAFAEIHATGQPRARIYATRRDPNQSR